MSRATLALIAAACLTAAGCASGPRQTPLPASSPTPVKPKILAWGEPATVVGENGAPLRLTPIGVLYSKGPYPHLPNGGPSRGWWVAIAIRGEALTAPDTAAEPPNGGFAWYGGQGEQFDDNDPDAANAPWIARVPVFAPGQMIQPGQPQIGVESFDVPAQSGALLEYMSPNGGPVVSWTLPASTTGTGLESVQAALRLFS